MWARVRPATNRNITTLIARYIFADFVVGHSCKDGAPGASGWSRKRNSSMNSRQLKMPMRRPRRTCPAAVPPENQALVPLQISQTASRPRPSSARSAARLIRDRNPASAPDPAARRRARPAEEPAQTGFRKDGRDPDRDEDQHHAEEARAALRFEAGCAGDGGDLTAELGKGPYDLPGFSRKTANSPRVLREGGAVSDTDTAAPLPGFDFRRPAWLPP